MQLNEALEYAFGEIRDLAAGAVAGLDAEALRWRPDPSANSIAWLVWHLTRVQDDHVSELARVEQIWTSRGWAQRFGLPAGYTDMGYGHSAEDVAAITPPGPEVLVDYHDEVLAQNRRYLRERQPADFDEVIDRSYDPPVTVGVRLMSVTMDTLQHVGQAGYVRGLWERRAR